MADKLPGSDQARDLILNSQDPLLERVLKAEAAYVKKLPQKGTPAEASRLKVVRQVFKDLKKLVTDVAKDRAGLFTNPALIEVVLKESKGELSEKIGDALLRHSLDQFGDSAFARYSGIEAEQLTTVDGRSLIEDAKEEVTGTIDAED